MKFFMGGNIDAEVYEVFRVNRNAVHERLTESLEKNPVEINLKEFSVHIFVRDDTPVEKTHVEYNKRQKRVETEFVIDCKTFRDADDNRRQVLIETAVRDSVVKLHERGIITAEETEQLKKWIDGSKQNNKK